MRKRLVWFTLVAASIVALVIADGGDAQPPGKKGGKKGGFAPPITADEIVERIMSFDKNNDGKITMDELPERMQHLIALGDTNKDGALDREEIRKLATTLEAFVGLTGGGGGGPPDGKKGDGPKGFKGGPKGGGEALRALDDLNITGKTRDRADRLVRAYQDKLKKFDELSRTELVLQMKDVLGPEDHRAFKDAVDRPPPGPPPFGAPKGPPDFDRRIDQLQKELDELRKKIAK